MNVDFWLNEATEIVGYEAGFIVLDGDGEHGGAEQVTLYFYDSRPDWREQSIVKLGELRDSINEQIGRLMARDGIDLSKTPEFAIEEARRGKHEHY